MHSELEVIDPVVGVSTLERPAFSAGLLLEDTDLTAGVEYTRGLSSLLFRSLFGCGVICGLDLDLKLDCGGKVLVINVTPGVALDCEGNPIEVPKGGGKLVYDPGCDPFKQHLWVAVCYSKADCRPRDTDCGWDSDGQTVKTRIRDGYKLKLFASEEPPDGVCMCDPKKLDENCGCGCCSGCCVLIGEITLPAEKRVLVADDLNNRSYERVRMIRPEPRACGTKKPVSGLSDPTHTDDADPHHDDPQTGPTKEPPRVEKKPERAAEWQRAEDRAAWLAKQLGDPEVPADRKLAYDEELTMLKGWEVHY